MAVRWLEIVGWEQFQHYRDREPSWIKNYTRLLSSDKYLSLSGHRRAVLHGLWLAYASSNRQLIVETSSLSARLNLRVTTPDLKALNHAGFIRFRASNPASKTLARRYQAASPEREVLRTSLQEAASAPLARARASRPEKNSEPPRDPEALTKLREIAGRIGEP